MTPEEIVALRQRLACGARALGEAVGVDQATVLAWERGALFPTKRYAQRLALIAAEGLPAAATPRASASAVSKEPPSSALATKRAISREALSKENSTDALALLADPAVWRLFRKLLAHPELRDQVEAFAETYPDPSDDP